MPPEPRRPFAFLPAQAVVGLAWLTTGYVVAVAAVHAWLAMRSGYYLSPTSGAWLALARDVQDGVLYRPIVGAAGYGGTRYAPLFFVAIGLLMKMGVPPLAAAFAVQIAAAAGLAAGVAALVRTYALLSWQATMLAALAVAPYFVQETLFEVRADVLAVCFTVLGLVPVAQHLSRRVRRWAMPLAALCFTLGLATKITAVAGPAAAVAALWLGGHRKGAAQLLAWTLLAIAVAFALIMAWSHGRVVASFEAVAFSDLGAVETLHGVFVNGPLIVVGGSVVLKVLFAAMLAAVLLDVRRSWRDPIVLFALASVVVTATILGSPGTVLQNQVVEPFVAALLCLGVCLRGRTVIEPVGYLVIGGLMLVSARHVASDIVTLDLPSAVARLPAEREALARAVNNYRDPVLSESGVFPVAAGASAYLVDGFALRVIAKTMPEVDADLRAKVDAHLFRYVILDRDPDTAQGAGFYRNLQLGWPALERILANYRLEVTIGRHRVYVPR